MLFLLCWPLYLWSCYWHAGFSLFFFFLSIELCRRFGTFPLYLYFFVTFSVYPVIALSVFISVVLSILLLQYVSTLVSASYIILTRTHVLKIPNLQCTLRCLFKMFWYYSGLISLSYIFFSPETPVLVILHFKNSSYMIWI